MAGRAVSSLVFNNVWFASLFAVVIVASLCCSATASFELPHISVEGGSYTLGFQVGKAFHQRIHTFIGNNTVLQQTLLPYYASTEGKKVYDAFVTQNQKAYPEIFSELKGIADGAEVQFHIIMLMNLEDEIVSILSAGEQQAPAEELSCSDILTHWDGVIKFGHNEDAILAVKDNAYMVTSKPSAHSFSKYTAYNYPGYLSGNAWGWNEHGIVFSANAVFPVQYTSGGISRNFITRDLFNSKSIEDAIARLGLGGRGTGFTINMASIPEQKIVNIEVAPDSYRVRLVSGNYSHFNMYRDLLVPQHPDDSSIHRLERANQFSAPKNLKDIATILGDTKDPQYPIFRDSTPPDCCSTVITALFDLVERSVSVYATNPKDTFNDPYVKMSLDV